MSFLSILDTWKTLDFSPGGMLHFFPGRTPHSCILG